jgi:hypothetical protein
MFTQLTDFCKKNTSLIIAIIATTLFTYGLMLFESVIGIDTDGAMAAYRGSMLDFSIATGRWGGEFLHAISNIMPYNPYIAVFCCLGYLALSALLWCALFDVFSKRKTKNAVGKILFSVLYITSPVWNELMYFHPSSFFFSQMLCPIIIYLILKGVQENMRSKKLWYIFSGILLAALVFSVYQAVIPYLCSGVIICFFLQSAKANDFSFKTVIKVLIVFVIAYLLYTVVDLIIKAVYAVPESDYVNNLNKWGVRSIRENIKSILNSVYKIFWVPFKQKGYILHGSLVLFPLSLLFVLRTLQRRNWTTFILGLCVVFSVMILPALGAILPPVRSMFVLPLVTGFLPLFLYSEWSASTVVDAGSAVARGRILQKVAKALLVIFVFCVSMYQAQVAIQIQYSDYRRHNADIRLAGILDERIQKVLLSGEASDTTAIVRLDYAPQAVPIAIFGVYNPFYFDKNFAKVSVSGWSIFAWDTQRDTVSAPTRRSVRLMQALGMNYVAAPYDIAVEAAEFAKSMPVYPARGCVQRYKGVVVVRLSENF